MKLSKAYWQTLKEVPSDAEVVSHKLLMRAGLIHKTTGGIYSYLPFAKRSLRKIEKIICEELEKIGAQEITMSMVTPSELWKESGRWDTMGKEMLRFQDRKEAWFCLSPTNEETVTNIFKTTISSYKDLPVNLFQINTKFRDEVRPRFGLMRGREFIMKDGYSFHLTKESLDETYHDYYKAYENIFKRMHLDFIIVEADAGAMGSKESMTHEFQVVADSGEDIVVESKESGYCANLEKAQTTRGELAFTSPSEIKLIETPMMSTCVDVANFLKIEVYQTLKTLLYTAEYANKKVHYMLLLLGDDSLNELKLKNFLDAKNLYPSEESTLKEIGVVSGFMSPLGEVQNKVSVLIDAEVDATKSYVVGGNKENYHAAGFTPERDLKKFKSLDLRLSREGDFALDRKSKINFRRGIEVGHIFELGNKYTKSMDAAVLDQNGKKIIPLMGCYGIGVSRTLAAAIEQNHDENGIIWPAPIAPYHVYFAVIGKKEETKKLAQIIYEELIESKIEVLFDDRGLSPGLTFKDADLLGLPLRLVLGERDYEKDSKLELKLRRDNNLYKLSKDELIPFIKAELLKQGLSFGH